MRFEINSSGVVWGAADSFRSRRYCADGKKCFIWLQTSYRLYGKTPESYVWVSSGQTRDPSYSSNAPKDWISESAKDYAGGFH